MRKKALDKEHVDDDNDRHMIKNRHIYVYINLCIKHKSLTVPIALQLVLCAF